MIDAKQLRDYVVRPVLQGLDMWSEAAELLVLATAMQESKLTYIHQLGAGPALGLWQVEPATHTDLWTNWLRHRPLLANKLLALCMVRTRDASPFEVPHEALVWNLAYGAAICRMIYRRSPKPLPAADDYPGLWAMYKAVYNSALGKATEPQFMAALRTTKAGLA